MTHEATVHVRRYLVVFGALFALTIVTVAISYLRLPAAATIAVGLVIAGAKAALVAMFFMHLIHERATIFMTLALTAVIFAGLIGFTLWTEADHAPGTRFTQPFEEAAR